MYKKIAILILLVSMSFAQEKIGVVFSERILEKSTEFNDLSQQAQLQAKKVQDEYDRQFSELQTLAEEIDGNRLAWTPDLLKAKEQEFQDMENALQRYLAGSQDEFTKWQRSAEYELIMKINKIIETMAINEGYDLILEASGGVKYTKGAYDLTDDVLYELNNTAAPSDSTPE